MRTRHLAPLALLAVIFLAGAGGSPGPATLKFEVQLIWGTNDNPSPDPKHKPVDDAIRKKIDDLPLKWSNYFEINRQTIEIEPGGSKKIALSEKCEIELHDLGKAQLEITHFGKGTPTRKNTTYLPKGDIFVLGGNAPNASCWLVALRRVE